MSVRSGAGGASASTITLPLAWAADTVPETVALITELHQMVSNGYELRDALARVQAPAVAVTNTPSSPSRWTSLVEKFQADLQITNGIKPKTWRDNYGPFLAFTVEQLGSTAPPVNARELLSHVAEKWQDYPRRREVAINAVSKFLD
ncbi:MAG: hypothetical protein QNL52_00810 [Synechococcus sp. ChBW.bin.23]